MSIYTRISLTIILSIVVMALSIIFCIFVLTQDGIGEYLGFAQTKYEESSTIVKHAEDVNKASTTDADDQGMDDALYRRNKQALDWGTVNNYQGLKGQFAALTTTNNDSTKSIEIKWDMLTNIDYKLRYFEELELDVYVPEFSEELKALDGKEVIIEGFIIPFDDTGEFLSLSANPFASCFFCGNASPASVLSMYLKDKDKRYKMDDFKKFKGILHLNYDDPEEFYYILRDAQEI